MQTTHLGDAAPTTFKEMTRVTPSREPTTGGDVRVPLAQAVITSVAITVSVGVLAASQGWSAYIPIGAAAVTFSLAWLYLLADSRGLLRITERITGRDFDGDGQIADQPIRATPVRIEVTEQRTGGTTMHFLDLPLDEQQMRTFAKGILAGRPFSEREWSGDGKPLSQNDFAEVRDKLIGAGFARWKGGERRMGAELTAAGRSVFGKLVGDPTPPLRG